MKQPPLINGSSFVAWEMLMIGINSEKLFHTLSYAFVMLILIATLLDIFVLSENTVIISVYLEFSSH